MAATPVPNQLLDLLRALRRRRYQVIVPALLVATLGIAFAVIVPKRYRVSMRVEIGDRTRVETDPRLRNPQDVAVRREAASASDHIHNAKRVKDAVEANLTLWPEYVQLQNENERNLFIRKAILDNLSAQPTNKDPSKGGTIFIDVAYSDENSTRAAKLIEDLVTSWLREVFESDRTTLISERNKFKDLLGVQEGELNDLQGRLYQLFVQLGVDPSASNTNDNRRDDPRDWTFQTLDKTKTELDDVESKLHTAAFELEQAQERLAATPEKISKKVEQEAEDPSSKIEEKKTLLEEMQDRIANLSPLNSEYKRLRPKIDKLEEEIHALETGAPESDARWVEEDNPLHAEYADAARKKTDEVGVLTERRANLQSSVEALTHEAQDRSALYKDLDERKNQVAEAQLRVNQTRRDWQDCDTSLQLLDASPQPWSISSPALPSAASTQPNPLLLSAVAVFAGLALGLGLAVVSEFARSCYRSAADLASVMSVPSLGAIDTIVTRKERRRLQLSHATAGLSTALIVGTIGWITWVWSTAPERLPLELQDAIEHLRSALK